MKSELAQQDRYPVALLHQLELPLERVLWCLAAAEEVHPGQGLYTLEIEEHLRGLDVEVARGGQIANALNRARDLVVRIGGARNISYRISHKGRARLDELAGAGKTDVLFVEAGQKWSKPLELVELCDGLKGDLLVADPYYGEKSLLVLARLARRKGRVKFLTEKVGGGEKAAQLAVEATDLASEYKNLELRRVKGSNRIHDRFVLADSGLVIVGAGLKDLGLKHSFIVHLDAALIPDMIAAVRSAFLAQWTTAGPF